MWGSFALVFVALGVLVAPLVGQTADLERRVAEQESIHADRRLSVIETRLDSIEFLGRGILLTVGGQLLLNGLALKRRFTPREEPRIIRSDDER